MNAVKDFGYVALILFLGLNAFRGPRQRIPREHEYSYQREDDLFSSLIFVTRSKSTLSLCMQNHSFGLCLLFYFYYNFLMDGVSCF